MTLRRHLRSTLPWCLALTGAALFAGCSDDGVTQPGAEVSDEARATTLEKTTEVLQAQRVLQSAQTVEDLTGGFAVGIADEAAGLEMELGGSIDPAAGYEFEASLGARLVSSGQASKRAVQKVARIAAKVGPGDLLFQWSETNFDGSVSQYSVYQGEPEAVVRVVKDTTWPNGHLLFDAIRDEFIVDRGADFEIDDDDTWLYFLSRIDFNGGQSLQREIDAREQGGLRDDLRVELVSTFTPRPGHPRLVDVVSTIAVDLHQLDDSADDRFASLERITRLSGTAHDGSTPRVEESFVPEQPVAEGEDACGGELSRTIVFRDRSALEQWTDTASWACEGGGSLSRRVDYADGSFDALTLTENVSGIVSLEATERDGTTTSGEYDPAQHAFEFTTAYPQGADPVMRSVQGSTNADETAWQLDEQVTFADSFIETNHLEGSENEQGKRLAGTHDGRDGSVSFVLESNLDETLLEGHIENDQDQTVDFTLEKLADGGELLDFVATEPGVRVEGHLEVGADGCGTGTIEVTENGQRATFEVSFCDDELDAGQLAAR